MSLTFLLPIQEKKSNIWCPSDICKACYVGIWGFHFLCEILEAFIQIEIEMRDSRSVTANWRVKSHLTVTCVLYEQLGVLGKKKSIWRSLDRAHISISKSPLYFINYTCSLIQEVLNLQWPVFGGGGWSTYLGSRRKQCVIATFR